jgi:hypothetical protein
VKKLTIILSTIFIIITLTSCSGSPAQESLKTVFENKQVERIAVTNSRYAGRYTIIDKKGIERFKNRVLKAEEATIENKLDADFTFEFFDETKKLITFKYIAGINDKETANLIDENGRLYHVTTSIEDDFMKRLMKREDNRNIPEYYISLIGRLIEKSGAVKDNTVIVDIGKDYTVTRAITSIEQKSILDSIDQHDVKIRFPGEVEKWDYTIKIRTNKYSDTYSEAAATITDSRNISQKYQIVGDFKKGKWTYHIYQKNK